MKNGVLFGYGKMGSAIAKGWKLKNLNFNFFVVEKEVSLRKIASNEIDELGDISTLADPSIVDKLISERQNK